MRKKLKNAAVLVLSFALTGMVLTGCGEGKEEIRQEEGKITPNGKACHTDDNGQRQGPVSDKISDALHGVPFAVTVPDPDQ